MSLTLLDWRRQVAGLYAEVRRSADQDPEAVVEAFRMGRDTLFRDHPESPLPPPARIHFRGLSYWPHDPAVRFEVAVELRPDEERVATSMTGEEFPLRRIGLVHLPIGDLEVYWIDVYGGGVFLPFRDLTAGDETYGAGRYLLDTVKGADLGGSAGRLIVDFNYAYHPSCAYDPRWSCPLAPRANWLPVAVRAGERL